MISIIMAFRIRAAEYAPLWDLTVRSVYGILNTADQDYELIVLDNGSHSPEYAAQLNRSHVLWGELYPHILGFRLLRFDEPNSLAMVWNAGIHQSDGNYIILANNDIIYHEKPPNGQGWMTRLLEPFSWLDRKIGIVGIQHMSWNHWSFVEGSLFAIPSSFKQEFNVSGDEFTRVFDEEFTFSCEDVDLNARVQGAGYETIQVNSPPLQPVWLQHIGHQTIQSLIGSDESIIELTHENRKRLCRKYGYPEQIVD